MKTIYPQELSQFARGFRFAGGKLRRVRIFTDSGTIAIEFGLLVAATVRDLGVEARAIRLKLRLEGVEEFRFQKRPNSTAGRVSEAKFGFFDGLIYVNFDAWGLQPGEVPGVHDFRASDAYAAGKTLRWQEITRQANTPG